MKFKVNSSFVDDQGSGEVELLDMVFAKKVNENAIYEILKNQHINRRQGNATTKTVSEVSGTTKKPWKQKGTGNARAGTRRSPLFAGGGVVFGPQKRDFSYAIPKKVKRNGIFSLLSKRVGEGNFYVLEDVVIDEFKTSKVVEIFKPLSGGAKKKAGVVFVVSSKEKSYRFVKKSSDNIAWLKLLNVESLEMKDLFYADCLVFSKTSISVVNQRYSSKEQ